MTGNVEQLHNELVDARAKLREHMASPEFAYANGHGCSIGGAHPTYDTIRARTKRLAGRVADLKCLIAEHDEVATMYRIRRERRPE